MCRLLTQCVAVLIWGVCRCWYTPGLHSTGSLSKYHMLASTRNRFDCRCVLRRPKVISCEDFAKRIPFVYSYGDVSDYEHNGGENAIGLQRS